ncbi:DUF2470 domain-containing protein [Streptomyces apocyni]|uniref:DUF2470 domain-containing protein n=1 Tax=Streptomyces apocyni TaxID=2654677 RepID=UPI001E5C5641|nr:DUF2470 domain-containing protein [Streptomyces apocyni]
MAAAESLLLVTDGRSYELAGLHALDGRGRLRLRVPDDCGLATEVALAPRGIVAALLKFTDIAPTAVRDRVRARVTLSGWLTPVGRPADAPVVDMRLDFAHAELAAGPEAITVGLDELTLASSDPLAVHEADMLTHLIDVHSDELALLARLVDARLLRGAPRVLPLAVDRYGITLRLEHTHTHHDVRLPFPTPLHHAAEAGDRVQTLLAAARACPRLDQSPLQP